MTNLDPILIANRGEIAVRIARTARELGYRTVAIYSDADRDAPHVHAADTAVRIGPAPVRASYLNAAAIVAAATRAGAGAVHPGYGFLAENADFARACAAAGLVFVGPPADAIALMGSKRRAKQAMTAAGVRCIPGYDGADQDDATLLREARRIGFPLLIKASAGGGGRGMRRVTGAGALAEHLNDARSEAHNAFGDGELILERALDGSRHIEIQVFADRHGNVVHLGERDCSIQRRHQKVVEEAPSPFVDAALRARMGAAAVRVAQACDYVGAGTVEFLVDAAGEFYFLEMNTRLQVEHPVTELVTGTDLVAWQLQVAAGEPLPLQQPQIELAGHAIEARLYAEDPRIGFLPQTGRVLVWDCPARAGVRVDSGIATGDTIGSHYDPLLAKIVAHGPDRATARRRLAAALEATTLLGVGNNRAFLAAVCRHPAFAAGEATTAFLDEHLGAGPGQTPAAPSAAAWARAALLFLLLQRQRHPERSAHRWRSAAPRAAVFRLQSGDATQTVELREHRDGFATAVDAERCRWRLLRHERSGPTGLLTLERDGQRERIPYAVAGERVFVDDGSGHCGFANVGARARRGAQAAAGGGRIVAPTDGAVVAVRKRPGDPVTVGATVAVLEAMKMEHRLTADLDGTVASIDVAIGDQVRAGQLVALLRPAGAADASGDDD